MNKWGAVGELIVVVGFTFTLIIVWTGLSNRWLWGLWIVIALLALMMLTGMH